MADFSFPSSDFDRPATLKALLGSFWSDIYDDQATLDGMIEGRALLGKQMVQDLNELESCMGRFLVPTLHLERWLPMTFRLSEMNTETAVLRYDDGAVYGNQPEDGTLYRYGLPANVNDFSFPLPTELVGGEFISNAVTEPTVSLVAGVDYLLMPDRGAIVFRDNPFDNPLLTQQIVYDSSGAVADRTIALWLYAARTERELVYRHFGYILGLPGRGEQYKELVNALIDSIVEGTTLSAIQVAIAACTGIPFVAEDDEVVELVTEDDRGLVIATDRRVYRFPADATPIVSAGDNKKAGQPLVSTVEVLEFQRGACPDDLRALTMGKGFLAEGFFSELTFENKDVDLVVEEDVDGYTKVSFELGGFPADVEKFFDDMHSKGVAKEQTLAMLLDTRVNKTGQPRAGSLPDTINPLHFLIENILRQHTFLVRVHGNLGEDALGLRYLRQVRKFVPPHTAMLLLVELEGEGDGTIMEGPGDETAPGYEEDPEIYLAMEAEGDEVGPDTIDENPRLYQVSDRCL